MALVCIALVVPSSHGLVLVARDMAPTVYVAADSDEEIGAAAKELADVLSRMTDLQVEVEQTADPGKIPGNRPAILLGHLAESAGLAMEQQSLARDGFRYAVRGNRVLIVGESPRGIHHGVYRFLESLGCGWYTPGELGEVIPRTPVILVPDDLDHSEVSNATNRRVWFGGKGDPPDLVSWRRRNCGDCNRGSWNHAWAGLVNPRDHFEQHPEYFGLKRGNRSKSQLCTTHPETIRIAAEALVAAMGKPHVEAGARRDLTVHAAGPNDGGNLCECVECAKLDTPGYLEYSSGKPACGDRIFMFANALAETTSRKFPDKGLGVLVYSEYSRVPAKLKQLHPNVFPMIAPIRRCRFHGPGNPVCEMAGLLKEEILGWSAISSGKMGFYPYNYNLADTMVPFSKIGYYRDLQKTIREAGIKELAWIPESMDSWATHAPTLYLSVRMTWNSEIDIDAEMERFFNGFYGGAAGPMKSYWMRMDQAYVTADTHAGSQYGLHRIWTDELLTESRRDIDKAKQLARTPRTREAVDMADAGLVCAEQFIRIHQATVAFDFQRAARVANGLESFIGERDEKSRPTPPRWFHKRYAWGYYARFSGRTVTGGAKIMEDGGRVLARLPDEWKFKKDQGAVGIAEAWFDPKHDDSNWEPFATYSASWVDQGLTWYHGDAWYRTTFQMPKVDEGSDLRLWFGGFDNNVDVYLNGTGLGERTGFATPAEFAGIAGHLKLGDENVLAVRVSSGGLAEIGTGGIMKPVMVYEAARTPEGRKSGEGKTGVEYEM